MPTIELRDYTERALKRISPIYSDSRFIREFFNGVGISYDLLREYFTTFSDQSFIDGVSWAIALQELKYSLDIREDLTLEQRRARLGIKARTHRPLDADRLSKNNQLVDGRKACAFEFIELVKRDGIHRRRRLCVEHDF